MGYDHGWSDLLTGFPGPFAYSLLTFYFQKRQFPILKTSNLLYMARGITILLYAGVRRTTHENYEAALQWLLFVPLLYSASLQFA
jgi:hypothetical protein